MANSVNTIVRLEHASWTKFMITYIQNPRTSNSKNFNAHEVVLIKGRYLPLMSATPVNLKDKMVTIVCNKFDGHPKGFAYIEFGDKDCVQTAMALNESLFKGRQIKVMPKRTNKPGLSTTNRPPRSMRGRGRSFRGGFSPYYSRFSPYYSGFSPNYSGFSPNYSGYRPVRRGRNNPYVYVNNTASKK